MEASVDPPSRGPDWMPITPKTGSLLHAETQEGREPCLHKPFGHVWNVRASRSNQHGNGGGRPEVLKTKEPRRSRFADVQWFKPLDEATLPPRRFLYGKHYQRGTPSGTISPGGIGKSSLGIIEGLAMATGRNLLGEQPEERCRVWIHNGEDGLDELNRRVVAACKHYGTPQTELDGWLILTSGTQFPLRIARGFSDLKIDDELIGEMTKFISEKEIDVAILEPLVTLHNTDGNSPEKMDAVVRVFKQLAEVCDCAIEVTAHTRKLPHGAAELLSIDDARGAGSIKDALRAVRILNVMSREEASVQAIGEFERWSYFRVDRGKANYQPPMKAAVWRKFESVELLNGDNVGVITAWEHPEQNGNAPTESQKKAEEVFYALLHKVAARGEAVSHVPSRNYAPALFCNEPQAKAAGLTKATLARAMQRLIDTGRIYAETYRRDGRTRNRLVVARSQSTLV
jgi:hypothetical protein